MMRPLATCVLAVASSCLAGPIRMAADTMATAAVPDNGRIAITDYGYRDWGPELVHYRVDTARFPPGKLVLLDQAGRAVPFQIDDGVLSFVASAAKGKTTTYVLKRSLLVFPLVLAALPLIFTMEGPTLFSLEIGAWTLTISQTGLERFVSIALKSWISVQAGIVLTATTQFPELLVAMRAVKVPQLLVAIFGLMWRYLFILVDEAMRLQRARSARSGQASPDRSKTGGSVAWRARVTGGMAGKAPWFSN